MKHFITKLKKLNLFLIEKNGDLILKGLKGKLSAEDVVTIKKNEEIVNFIKENKAALIDYLLQQRSIDSATQLNLKDVAAIYELSPLQQGMLFHGLYDSNSNAYTEHFNFNFPEGLNIPAFKAAWEFVLKNHSILRTSFIYDQLSIPVQCVFNKVELPFELLDFSQFSEKDLAEKLDAFVAEDLQKGFDFKQAPLMRITLIKTSDIAYKMVWSHHHILWDGWSVPIMMDEMLNAYEAFLKGESPEPIAEDHYEDYIKYINTKDKYKEEQFWKQYMQGFENPSLLPFIGNTPDRNKGGKNTEEISLVLDKTYTENLKNFAQRNHLTVNTLIQGVWSFLLSKYTGNSDTTFGVIVSGRPTDLPGAEEKVGLYINTLPLRSTIKENQSVKDWLTELQKGHTQAREYQYSAINKVKKWSGVQGEFFDSILVFENYPIGEVLEHDWALRAEVWQEKEQTNYLMSIAVAVMEQTNVKFLYNADLLEQEYAEIIKGHFQTVLDEIVVAQKSDIHAIDMLTQNERHHLLKRFNNTDFDYPREKTIVDIFEEQVQHNPDKLAVVFGDKTLTYQELDERSNQMAHCLLAKGVKYQDRVAILSYRGLEMIISLFGVLKCGATYVPLNIDYPLKRLEYLLEDSSVSHVIYSHDGLLIKSNLSDHEFIGLEALNDFPSQSPGLRRSTQSIAYVMYTSGTTGEPKGILVNQQNILKLCFETEAITVQAEDKVMQWSNFSFDGSTYEIYSALLNGASLHMISEEDAHDPSRLAEIIQEQKITVVFMTTALFNGFVDYDITALKRLRRLLFGGELVSVPHVKKALKVLGEDTIIHVYGPTETTVYATYYPIRSCENDSVPIGRPLSNTSAYIIDSNDQLVGIGVAGELCIGGEGVSMGYLNRAELTAEKFIKNPFHKTGNKHPILYKTGDLVCWLPDGNIDFIGRKDAQVKIRGYRIELGEIETALQESPLVSKCVVLAKADANGNKKRLVAYIVPETEFDREGIQSYLQAQLPEYMVPSLMVEMDDFPLNSNGKVDKKALPEPDTSALITNEYLAPRDELEETIAEVWKKMLNIEKVGVYDNFFELGGDSIISIQVVSRIKRAGYQLQPRDLFKYQTIAALAELIKTNANTIVAEQGILTGNVGLLPIQQWFLEKGYPSLSHFNQENLFEIDKNISSEHLDIAIKALVRQHDALRFQYRQEESVWIQEYGAYEAELEMVDLSETADTNLSDEIEKICQNYQESLSIEKGELIKAVLIKTPASVSRNRLFIVIHHFAVDGVSWRIILDQLHLLIEAYGKGESLDLGMKSSSFRQWVAALEKYSLTDRINSQLPYWQTIVKDYQALPVDFANQNELSLGSDSDGFAVSLEESLTQALLQEVNQSYRTNINDILLSALAMTISNWSGNEKVVIGLEGHGREYISSEIDTTNTVGWFTNLYPISLTVENSISESNLIKSVKEQLRAIPEKGIAYGLLRYLHPSTEVRDSLSQGKWDIVFNYLGQLDNVISTNSWLMEAEESAGFSVADDYPFNNKLEISGSISGGKLSITWVYSKKDYEASTINKLAEAYLENLTKLILHCQEKEGVELTAFDYGLSPVVNYKDLDQFLDTQENGIPRRHNIDTLYRLSPLQEGMLFHHLYDKNVTAYTEQLVLSFPNGLAVEAFKSSWEYVVSIHNILRTAFFNEELNIPVQCAYKSIDLPFELLDFSHIAAENIEAEWERFLEADIQQGFDFSRAPLMRISLVKTGAKAYKMLWTFHHILMDGWSIPILIENLLLAYEELLKGTKFAQLAEKLNKKEDRYEDYIQYIGARDQYVEQAFWKSYLDGFEAPSLLPFVDNNLGRNKGGLTREMQLDYDKDFTEKIKDYAQANRITVNTFVQGIWGFLLSKYTGNSDTLFGVTVSGRPSDMTNAEEKVGLFINAMPVRVKLDPTKSIGEVFSTLQEEHTAAREFQYTALNDIQKWNGIQGDFFDSLLAFENYPLGEVVDKEWSLEIDSLEIKEQTNYLFSMAITLSEVLNLKFGYNLSLLPAEFAEMIKTHFELVIDEIVVQGKTKFSEIELLTKEEKELLLHTFNDTKVDYPTDKTSVDVFEEQVALTPDNIALVFEDQKLTYKALNERANQLAHHLRSKGVKEESIVAICIDRSLEMIVGIMGILKAGGAYLPIDAEYPQDRIDYIVEDSQTDLIVTTSANANLFDTQKSLDLVMLDENWSSINSESRENPKTNLQANNLAYVIYTSGSTGRPKGVMIEHRSKVNSILAHIDLFAITPEDRVSQFISLSFDASVPEIFMTLLAGARLVLFSKEIIDDQDLYLEYIKQQKLTVCSLPPAYLSLFDLDEFSFLRVIMTGGDIANVKKAVYCASFSDFFNLYGPTECTICIAAYKVDAKQDESRNALPIGKPFSNNTIYILDQNMQLLPPYAEGEICISGANLARGYLHRSELTAEKFIPNPFNPKEKLYRTGDKGKWLKDGNIAFLGRIDDQVKIRGQRLELGEVEAVLQACALVNESVVLAKKDTTGNKRLVAYILPEGIFDKEGIEAHLKAQLPDYMIPSILMELDKMPLTPHNKIDKKALPEPNISELLKEEYLAPRNETEQQLVVIWKRLLNLDRVGVLDNFFELGGHSLLATRVVSAIRKELKVEIAIKDLFTNPSIAGLSEFILTQGEQSSLPEITLQERPEKIPLSYAQDRLWFIDKMGGSVNYHMPIVLRFEEGLDIESLSYAFNEIVNRHEILRTVYREEDGLGYQFVLPKDEWQLDRNKLSDFTKDGQEENLSKIIEGEILKAFDLSKDYMLRAQLLDTDNEELLILVIHHIASDGWSMSIFVDELTEIYSAKKENRVAEIPPLTIQYADYAIWQKNYLSGAILEKKLKYWENKLSGIEALNLPLDFPRPAAQSTKGASINFSIEKPLSEALKALTKEEGVTMYMLLMAAMKVLLYRYSGQDDICIGSSIANRTQTEVEPLIGFFVNTLALRSDLSENPNFKTFLVQVKTTVLEALARQEVPFEKVVDQVVTNRDRSRSPLFQVLLVVQNNEAVTTKDLSETTLSSEDYEYETSKFELSFFFKESEEGLTANVIYCTDLFLPATIQRMITHFQMLLSTIVANPTQQIAALEMLEATEKKQLLEDFSEATVEYSKDKTLVNWFEEQVDKTPDQLAVVFEDKQLTYAELNDQANRLAKHLIENYKIQPDDLVGIMMEASELSLVSMLGILKAGAAYVPIDMEYPMDRKSFILEDTQVKAIIIHSDSLFDVIELSLPILSIDIQLDELEAADQKDLAGNRLKPDHLAYVIYTSGSTGQPKGVLVTHRNLTDYLSGLFAQVDLTRYNSFGLMSTLSADLGNTVLYGGLMSGGTVHMFSKTALTDANYIQAYFKKNPIDCIKIVPSHWRALETEEGILLAQQAIIFGGEKLSTELVEKIKMVAPKLKVINHYGPTETTVGKLLHQVDFKRNYHSIPIGKPFSNTSIYVVAQDNALCPIGVPGELLIGGVGVARGYLNLPEQTKERFIKNPFKADETDILYKTGDLVCMLEDGSIDFRGRVDSQVKIRGFRVELGEIEKILQESPSVDQAVVIAQSDASDSKRLVAYVVPEGDFDKDNIQAFLFNRLPDYMVPAIMIELAELPLTANGKINRKALPNPDVSNLIGTEYLAPRNEIEIHLVNIWKEILEIDKVGVLDNFFELGGHSLLAIRVVSAIRKEMSIEIGIVDLFDYVTIATLAEYLSTKETAVLLPPVTAEERPERIPLSFSQERLWFLDQLEGSSHYHIPSVQRFGKDLDKDSLIHAFTEIVNRHEVLRTVFVEEEGQVYQYILPENLWTLDYEEKLNLEDEELELLIETTINKAFDLTKDHLLRAKLVKVSTEEYLLVLVLHHIASDGWSNSIFFGELIELYEAKQAGRAARLQELSIQYADYALWQRRYLEGSVLDNKLQYWEEKLKGVEALNLPTDFVRPALQSTKGAHLFFDIDKGLSHQIQTLAQQEGVTLFMLLLSAFKVLLYKYTGQEDISVGSPIANRTQAEIEVLIGFFVNTLTLRSDLSDNPSFHDLLDQVKTTTLEAYDHQDVPFEKIVDRVVAQRDMSRTPLFQVMFILGNNLDISTVELSSDSSEDASTNSKEENSSEERFEYEISKFDLSFNVSDNEESLSVAIEYCSDLFSKETIERMMKHYEMLLSSICSNSKERIDQLAILDTTEEKQILLDFNNTDRAYPTDITLVDLFEAQVSAIPKDIALVFEQHEISYQELNERANQLAHYLQDNGLKKESLVCICIDRSIEMMVGILAILKAGAAYVPIDPSYPAERMNYILEDTATDFAMSHSSAKQFLETAEVSNLILLDKDWKKISEAPRTNLTIDLAPENLAYIIYTSGSTGKPKGVMNQHSGVVNRLLWTQEQYNLIRGEDVILQKTTFCFDVSVWELFWPFVAGIKLVFASPDGHKDNAYLKSIIKEQKVTTMHFVPSMLEVFLPDVESEDCLSLRRVLCSGEALKPSHVSEFRKRLAHTQLHNLYGPTEAAIDVSYWEIPEINVKVDKVPIGKPVANTKLYILDKHGQLCPIGVPGELHIAGIQVARGYHNRPALTSERFIEDKFTQNASGKLYKTGDFTRWLANGDIEYFRRLDDQVKIRGFRIELGEIEAKLQESSLVNSSIVLAKTDATGDKRLVAYIIPKGTYDKKAIQVHLKKQLPDYMVPSIMMELEAFPLTSNGKIDKKALPNPDASELLKNEYVAPRNETEIQLAEIWKNLMHLDKVGVHDNFFELGGHSLLATKLVSAIRKELQKEVPIREIFLKPTIASLAEFVLSEARSTLLPEIVVVERPANIPLSFSQERLWLVDKLEGSTHYHIPTISKFKGELNAGVLAFAFKEIVNRHESLRTVFEEIEGEAYQKILDKNQFELDIVDFSEEYDPQEEAALEAYADKYINKPFDLSKDHLMRAQLVKLSDDENALIVVQHHIVTDGWSGPIFFNELLELYTAKLENRMPELPELSIQYADYAIWQRSYLKGDLLQEKLNYWNDKLSGTEILNLPTDFEQSTIKESRGAKMKFLLDKELSAGLKKLAQEEGVTLFMLLLSIYKILLHKYSGQEDICVGIPIANRTHKEIEPLIGFFLNTLALRDNLDRNISFRDLLHQIKQTTLEAYTHQDVPFEKVLERVQPDRQLHRAPLFQVFFTMLNQWSEPESLGNDLNVETINEEAEELAMDSISETESESKFDITLYVSMKEERIGCLFAYNTKLFREERMKDMTIHFQQLAASIIADRHTSILELNYLSEKEKDAQENELMEFFND